MVQRNIKMPSVFEASLFSTETMYFADIVNQYTSISDTSLEQNLVERLWWNDPNSSSAMNNHEHSGWIRYHPMKNLSIESKRLKPILPIGLHATYKYDLRFRNKISSQYMVNECPYLPGAIKSETYFEMILRLWHLQTLRSKWFLYIFNMGVPKTKRFTVSP
jgi:hypothetical protein